ncbi:MAG: GspH/FimT family pseudopilin [Burkholderiales bacterium]|jgi:type IV fimbrial biogenesis protein FimT|nr:GspH/FimT family pseudopilin [Burkholderiales bacterium]
MRRRFFRGLTLVEMIIVMALIAGTLTMATISIGDWLTKSHQRNLVKALDSSIARARTEAIKRNTRVNICVSADQQTCTQGSWEKGWIIFPDTENSRTLEVNDAIIYHEAGDTFNHLTATGNQYVKSYLSFINNGKPQQLSGALQSGTIEVCARGQNVIKVFMAATGRTRIENTSTLCP